MAGTGTHDALQAVEPAWLHGGGVVWCAELCGGVGCGMRVWAWAWVFVSSVESWWDVRRQQFAIGTALGAPVVLIKLALP